MPPHSLTLTMVGAGLLWVGWFGFNAGSNLEANGYASLALINTFVATAAAGLSWMVVEMITHKKASALGLASGIVAGLVAITPAAGFAGPMGSIVLGLVVSPVCIFFCTVVKNALKYDDSLDAFGIHASAASSAPSAPACWSTPPGAAPASSTTRPARPTATSRPATAPPTTWSPRSSPS
jgi:Amt family ammonium transporter